MKVGSTLVLGLALALALAFALGLAALAGWRLDGPQLFARAPSASTAAIAPRDLNMRDLDVLGANARTTRKAMVEARAEARLAQARARSFRERADQSRLAAMRSANEAAAQAAMVQRAEAALLAARARLALIRTERQLVDARLAKKRKPLVELTAALQQIARRPLALSLLQPGSLKQAVYLRATLESALPAIRRKTAALRGELDRQRALEGEAKRVLASLRREERQLTADRQKLEVLARKRALASRKSNALAQAENSRAMALGEKARDLDGLVSEIDRAGSLRRELARLSGPIMRPARPQQSQVVGAPARDVTQAGDRIGADGKAASAPLFQLPVLGRTIAGFGAPSRDGTPGSALVIAPSKEALVVAPMAGTIAFAGPYRFYGQIVIIENADGWTSLVTGLARLDVSVGNAVISGSPIGRAGARNPQVSVELRKQGTPVNPLLYM